MRKPIALIICLMGTLTLVPVSPVQAKSIGYDRECRSSSKWKYAKQHRFSMRGQSYRLIESHTPDEKTGNSYASFCLIRGNFVKVIKLENASGPLRSDGNSHSLAQVSDGIFTIEFIPDVDDGVFVMYYKIDMRNPQTPKSAFLKSTWQGRRVKP